MDRIHEPVKIAYLIPEFPGQTHIWMWREIVWMRRWGVDLHLFSTRRPNDRDRARHGFAEAAAAETFYLWPPKPADLAGAVSWAMTHHPAGLAKAIKLGLTLPVDDRPIAKTVLPLVAPACVLAREMSRRGLSHLHSHTCSNSAILGMMVKRILGVSFSLTLNANIEWWGGAMAEKFADAEFTIAITEWLLRQMKRDFPALREDQAVLGRIGVDTDRWAPSKRESERGARPARIIAVGRLHPSKGYDVLLTAIKKLLDQGRDLALQIIGAGPEREALEAQVARDGIGGRVTFLGSLAEDRIIDHLDSSDVFVLSSHAEPLGVVCMEAMSMGVPLVGTAAGGVGEIVTDGVDGLLVPPNDADALAAAVARLLDDEPLRRRLAAAGRQAIIDRFDSRFGAASLYERMFGRPPPDGAKSS